MRRSPIRPISKKRLAQGGARERCIQAVSLRAKGKCEIKASPACKGKGNHCHEKLPRAAGGSITDPKNCLWSCWPCNQWCHDNPAEAYRQGWLLSRYPGKGAA